MNMQNLMAQAQKMQRDMQKKKEIIDAKEFEGSSELVKVLVNGKKDIISINISKDTSLEADDLEVLEDMIKIALNDAFKKVDEETDKEFGSYGNMLGGLM